MSTRAWLYDGERAVRHEVRLSRSASDLLLELPETSILVSPERLFHLEGRGHADVYGRDDVRGWRLGVEDPLPEVAALLPRKQVYGRWVDRIGLIPFIGIAIAASAALLFAIGQFPRWAAPLIPMEWEERFGDALVRDFRGRFCDRSGGQAALNKLAAQLSPKSGRLNIRVADIAVVNAAALPGGNIVIFGELLRQSDGPDEVAGVLAHEIAHVEERHVTQALLRELGMGIFIAAFGGTTGASVNDLMAASYSRGSEREADDRGNRGAQARRHFAHANCELLRKDGQEGGEAQRKTLLYLQPSCNTRTTAPVCRKRGQAEGLPPFAQP